MLKEAIILAGGKGTRLQSMIGSIPKPMAIINQQPFLNYIIHFLKSAGIERIVMSISKSNTSILQHFGSNFLGLEICYSIEDEPLGTGGAIYNALHDCKSDLLLIVNGDTLFNLDLAALYQFHIDKKSYFTLALKEVSEAGRFGSVLMNENFRIISFEEKNVAKKNNYTINGGSYLFDKEAFQKMKFPKAFSIEKDFFEKKYDEIDLYGFVSKGYFIDIGIPEDYIRAQNEFKQYKI